YIIDQNEFVVEPLGTHTEYLKAMVSNESSLTCSMLIEKDKRQGVSLKRKHDYVRYTV
ncbi:hypothetical protein F4703DRAFT_1712479, partial [Phycomyces blakesleeanus]